MTTEHPLLDTLLTSTLARPADDPVVGASDDAMEKMMSKATTAEELHYIMSAIVGPIICFVGMAGNLLSIVTWSRPKMRSSTGRYLTGQAVADFAVLLFFVLVDSLPVWCPDVKYSITYGLFFCYIGYPGIFLAVVCSIWYTVGVTVDRYIMVCWIVKAKRYCSERRANVGLMLITLNSFVINFPHYFSFSPVFPKEGSADAVHIHHQNVVNSTHGNNGTVNGQHGGSGSEAPKRVATFEPTEFTKGSSGQFYEFWIHCMILILIPWVTVFFMNIMIIRAVNKSNKKNASKKTTQSAKNSKDSETQITRLLLTVTFTFLLFIGVQCVVQCMYMKKPAGFNWLIVDSSFALAKCGIVFNSSLNFFLYCLTGRRFRQELLKIFGLGESDSQHSSLMERPNNSSSRQTTSSTGTTGI